MGGLLNFFSFCYWNLFFLNLVGGEELRVENVGESFSVVFDLKFVFKLVCVENRRIVVIFLELIEVLGLVNVKLSNLRVINL